jgi:hypothetical protein
VQGSVQPWGKPNNRSASLTESIAAFVTCSRTMHMRRMFREVIVSISWSTGGLRFCKKSTQAATCVGSEHCGFVLKHV